MRCSAVFLVAGVVACRAAGPTPDEILIAGIERGNESRVAAALAKGASANAVTREGVSAVAHAASRGRTAIVKLLAAKGARVNEPDQSGQTPLMRAARGNHVETYRALVKLGASPAVPGAGGATVLHAAVESGAPAMLQEVLQSGAVDIDARDGDGNTALMAAAALDRADMVKVLLDANAMVNAVNPRELGANALLRALRARYRVQSNAGVAADQGDTALTHARGGPAAGGPPGTAMGILPGSHGRTILLLLRGGTDVDHVTKDGATALMLAAHAGDLPLIDLLLAEKANVNLPGARGETPLIVAVRTGRNDVVQTLLDAGADVRARSRAGADAIAEAQRLGNKEMVKILKEGRRKAR